MYATACGIFCNSNKTATQSVNYRNAIRRFEVCNTVAENETSVVFGLHRTRLNAKKRALFKQEFNPTFIVRQTIEKTRLLVQFYVQGYTSYCVHE